MLRVLVLACVVSCMSNLLPADEPAAKLVTSIEGITEYHFENGFRVLLFPDQSKPLVTVNLTVFVGSRHEGYGEAGMAHLLEHMVFKGTPAHPKIPKLLTERGARFNGTTWVDRTNYYETLPASAENLEFAIQLEADRMVNSYHQRRRPGFGNVRGAQRVRAGRKQPFHGSQPANDVGGVPVAQLRAIDHWQPGGHRARARLKTQTVLHQILSAR